MVVTSPSSPVVGQDDLSDGRMGCQARAGGVCFGFLGIAALLGWALAFWEVTRIREIIFKAV